MLAPRLNISGRGGGIFHNLGSLKIFKIYMVSTQNRKRNTTIVNFSVRLLLWKIGILPPLILANSSPPYTQPRPDKSKIYPQNTPKFRLIIIVDDRFFFSPPTKNQNGIPNVKLICFLIIYN